MKAPAWMMASGRYQSAFTISAAITLLPAVMSSLALLSSSSTASSSSISETRECDPAYTRSPGFRDVIKILP
ncbi:hypothetical protein B0H17DRAFT_1040089 [Mycena rosella]|uniref:Uncharacterized protein n=1 Tax=Mycena rosella TaxID=1033263 RepID=A0AAD7M7B9_MYCRO|nr:hypothetical protein B0H17DRAFT_1040089 [Mycena rosella]